jgi:hypothetical protein
MAGADRDLFIELGAELGRECASFPGTDRNKQRGGQQRARPSRMSAATWVCQQHSWRAGLSYLRTQGGRIAKAHFEDVGGLEAQGLFDRPIRRTWIADFVWKWAPNGNAKDPQPEIPGRILPAQANPATLDLS